jgi:hypothetical protein
MNIYFFIIIKATCLEYDIDKIKKLEVINNSLFEKGYIYEEEKNEMQNIENMGFN